MSAHEQPLTPPDGLQPWLVGAEWQPITIGLSGAQVYRIISPEGTARYLKTARGPRVAELHAERDRLLWLPGRLPTPAVVTWEESADGDDDSEDDGARRAWLLLSEAPGVMACEPIAMADPQRLVRLLAEGLRRLHSVAIDDCPFGMPLDAQLSQISWRIDAGLVDEEAVRANHGVSARELLERLERTRPGESAADRVFIHGDYCLPNLLLDASFTQVIAYLDWGRAGVADRYQDLAIGARSVRYNLGAQWEPHFLAAYGLDALDHERLAWYELLDELF